MNAPPYSDTSAVPIICTKCQQPVTDDQQGYWLVWMNGFPYHPRCANSNKINIPRIPDFPDFSEDHNG